MVDRLADIGDAPEPGDRVRVVDGPSEDFEGTAGRAIAGLGVVEVVQMIFKSADAHGTRILAGGTALRGMRWRR